MSFPQTVVFRIDNPLVREGCTRPNHVHPVGDLNGDGLEDFMVGFACYRFSEDQANTGAAFLVYGNRATLSARASSKRSAQGFPESSFGPRIRRTTSLASTTGRSAT